MREPSLEEKIEAYGSRALCASRQAQLLDAEDKNKILSAMADRLDAEWSSIRSLNEEDVSLAEQSGLSAALCDRLLLNDVRFRSMVQGLREIAKLPDPVGAVLDERIRPNGLLIRKVRVPIGVIAIIYESRPNVTADAAGLCVRSSNAVILRGGSEALRSNKAIASALIQGGIEAGMPEHLVQFIDDTNREAVEYLVGLEGKVHLVIPRGGEGLIRAVSRLSRVPVLKHYKGVCHVYVDESADLQMAVAIVENAKCQRTGVCNAMETLLVHENCAERFLPGVCKRLMDKGVEIRGDARVRELVSQAFAAKEEDWAAEYLDLILAVKVVGGLQEAVSHINTFGSEHTDAIITQNEEAKRAFVRGVNSGVVMVNTSTRFNDGGEFGLGAEMGISTDRIHARGPVGPEELTTYQYVVEGKGQIRV